MEEGQSFQQMMLKHLAISVLKKRTKIYLMLYTKKLTQQGY